jgi:DNA repair exonuclease SbcCD ATPase subunit
MIDLESVTVEGFVSWGPYKTVLKLADMEQCFIVGTVYDKSGYGVGHGRSNGAGKSSLMQAILWCISGKTVYSQNPGNKILNWFCSTDAKVGLKFKNGSELTRIRTRSGNTELLFRRGSQEIINCTLSTTSNQQRLLDKELGFDYNLFCGSVFFSQYRQPWLAMADQTRRQAFERIMGIDRLSIYAEVAKAKYDKVVGEQEKRRIRVSELESSIANLIQQLDLSQKSSSEFEASRETRRQTKLQEAKEYEEKAKNCTSIDIDALTKKWNIVAKIDAKIDEIKSQITEADNGISVAENAKLRAIMELKEAAQSGRDKLTKSIDKEKEEAQSKGDKLAEKKGEETKPFDRKILDLRSEISNQKGVIETQNAIIKKWQDKSGKICIECERELPADYANSKIDKPQKNKATAEKKIIALQQQISKEEAAIAKINSEVDKLEASTEEAIEELDNKAQRLTAAIDIQLEKSIAAAKETSESIKSELQAKKKQLQQLIETTKKKLEVAKPDITVNEAKAKNSQHNTLLESVRRAKEEAKNIAAEKNTHTESIIRLGQNIKQKEDQVKLENKDLATYDIILAHLQYIQKAYSDRRKIKSYLISRHQPYFNSRLHHYLDLFNLDIKISLTESLGIESNLWGYDFQSGGERGRTDLAFMFSVFDLHQGMHGPQCNILVLDEPEKALDEAGRQMLISVIKDDLATRFESIFIISHSDCFHDVFPHQVTVERTDRFSHITDIR